MEQWKEIQHKGISWIVSNTGNVRAPTHSILMTRKRNGQVQEFEHVVPERDVSMCLTKSGYFEVAIMRNSKRVKSLVHRLVGLAHVPGYADGLSINHIDGNKQNNHANNLEWVSLARNTQHEWETGLVDLRGENQPNSKLTTKQVVYIRRLLAQGIPSHTLAIIAGVSPSTIGMIRDGKRWPTVTAYRPVVPS